MWFIYLSIFGDSRDDRPEDPRCHVKEIQTANYVNQKIIRVKIVTL